MDSNLNFNGLYVSRNAAFHGYRFFSDGTVMSNLLLNKKEKVTQSIISEQSHSMKGTYSINGDEISMQLMYGKIGYTKRQRRGIKRIPHAEAQRTQSCCLNYLLKKEIYVY